MNTKTITVATKGSARRVITQHRNGWPLPPEEGHGAWVGGSGAYRECVSRWEDSGWTIKREPNPQYRAPRLFSFA